MSSNYFEGKVQLLEESEVNVILDGLFEANSDTTSGTPYPNRAADLQPEARKNLMDYLPRNSPCL